MSRVKFFVAVVLGTLAFSAVASSMASAGWMVNGTNFTSGTKAIANTALVDESFKLTAANSEIKCTGTVLNFENPKINGSTGMGDAEHVTFKACKGNTLCPLAESMNEEVKTLPILVDLTLDASNTDAVKGRFLAVNTEGVFATFKYEGAECAVKGTQPIKGFIPFLAPTGQLERTLQLITLLEEKGVEVGKTEARMLGSILLRLTSGEQFSFLEVGGGCLP